ncbi:MarR family transcriptional regulator [Clostridium sp.]|uniref:MarR family winged helix-turn-helix transcriptional regulator n=1 Tax=Clostridium sp. TaxID=1506 RepID=UPI002585BEAF|nr:MarR family transcriptional regulator [Clostridium sp.]MDF2503629.1 MarR family transcriptional regulator [Clostridium sp.]
MEIQNILGYLLNTSARFIKRKMDKNLEVYNLTTSQWAVIKLLFNKKELTQAQIADELNSDRATSGTVILKLYEKKYIDKVIDKNDRRSYVISLTQKAKNAVKEIDLIAENITKKALTGLSDDNIKVLYDVLRQIINNLSEEEQNDDLETRDI